MSRYADICVNLSSNQLLHEAPEILYRAKQAGVDRIILVATDLQSAAAILPYAEQGFTYCTAGVHPHDAAHVEADWLSRLREAASDARVIAVGETGLDYFRNFSPRENQLACFQAQVEVALELDKPLFVHDRESEGDVYRVLTEAGANKVVIHCFTGQEKELRAYLDAGFHIGVTGWVTEKKRGETLRKLLPLIPLERLMVETDAPYLKPHNLPSGMAQGRRNEPAFIPWVVEEVARSRGEASEVVAEATRRNTIRLFGLE